MDKKDKLSFYEVYPHNSNGVDVSLDMAHSPFKLLAHQELLKRFVRGEKINPIHLRVGLTNKCNLRCNFCNFHSDKEKNFYDEFNYKDSLEKELAEKFFAEFAQNGGKAVTFCGSGECTIHPDYVEICNICHDNGLEIGLITNGSMLINDELSECISKTHTWVRIGMNAGSRENYERITHTDKENFDHMLNAVNKIRQKSVSSEFRIGMNFVITLENYHEIVCATKLCKAANSHYIRFEPEFYTGLAHKTIASKLSEIKKALEKAKKKETAVFEVSVPKLDRGEMTNTDKVEGDFSKCYYCNFVTALGADGYMYPCPQIHLNSEYRYGKAIEIGYKKWAETGEKEKWSVLNGDRRAKCKTCYYRPQNELLEWLKCGKLDLDQVLAEYKSNYKETLHKNLV